MPARGARASRRRQPLRERATSGRAGRARSRPTGRPARRGAPFVRTSCRCNDATSRSTSFFGRPVRSRSWGPVSAPSAVIAVDDRLLVGRRARPGSPAATSERQQPRRDAGGDAREVLPDADEALRRQLVLRAPEEGQLVRPADEGAVRLADRPVLARPSRSPAPRATAGRRPPSGRAARGRPRRPRRPQPRGCAPLGSKHADREAVSRTSLRRGRRAARRAGRAAVRRHLRRGARASTWRAARTTSCT